MRVANSAVLRANRMTSGRVRWALQRGRLHRPGRGLFLLGRGPLDLLDRVKAVLAACPPGAVVSHQTAAALLGFGIVPTDDIHVVLPYESRYPQRRGVVIHRSSVAVRAATAILGVPCTPAERCAIDLARSLPRSEALPVLDAALYAGACDLDALRRELSTHVHLRGIRAVRDLVELADPRAQCRQETQLRLLLHTDGLTSFEPQVEVVSGGRRYFLDLADRERRVGAEYDGSSHLDRHRLRADRARHNWLESHGWTMRYFTDRDLYQTPTTILDTLRRARSR